MSRKSTILTKHDAAGDFEIEIFDHSNPKQVIVCAHGNGVRRWDGERFYYEVAYHYSDSAVLLVDQNQSVGNGAKINPLPILVERVQALITKAKELHPGTPIIVLAHSMGCGVATFLDTTDVNAMIFVAPASGTPADSLIKRYGGNVIHGKSVLTSDGLTKIITAEYYDSIKGISWEFEYAKLVKKYSPVYVFEAGDDEILGDGRFAHRTIPFTSYEIIKGAKHNFSGKFLVELFTKIDTILG